MRIFLLGFMGSGKTHTGRLLAGALQYGFIDLDDRIEERAGADIPEIFRTAGESAFRAHEREALRQTASEENVVVATGGGTPCQFDNLTWINRHGISIFLEVPVAELYRRLRGEAHSRPLLAGRSPDQLRSFISSKLEERLPCYRQAHITVQAGISPDELVQRLTRTWQNITGH